MRLSHTPQENREEKTMRKRLLSLLLVLACVLTLAVVPVSYTHLTLPTT